MKLKTILIDDEIGAREALAHLIDVYCPQVELIAQAASVQEGVQVLTTTQPDVLLLDIRLGDGTGFELLKQLPNLVCQVIFITAYDQYALQALKCSALDYILKPIDPDELIAALQKAVNACNKKQQQHPKQDTLKDSFNWDARKLVLTTQENIHIVNIEDIIRCEATNNYTQFYLTNHRKLLVCKTLKEYDALLQDAGFFRVHHSHLINLQHLNRYNKQEGGTAIMSDQSIVSVSLRKKAHLLQLLKST